MRLYSLIAASLLFAPAAMSQEPFTIKGSVKGLVSPFVYLSYGTIGSYKTDSSAVKGGAFSFSGELTQPVSARMYTDKQAAMYGEGSLASFFIEPGDMTITGDNAHFDQLQLKGSASQKEQQELDAATKAVRAKLKPLSGAYSKLNKQYMAMIRARKSDAEMEPIKQKLDKLKEQMEPYYNQIEKIDMAFVDKHPDSYVSADILRWKVSGMPLEEGERYYSKMSAKLQQSSDGLAIRKELDGLKMGSPGNMAHDFSKQDINGETLSLAALRGKYVLLDFWASWCGPCRKGNPHLKSLYGKYKDKGLEIVGVSDDDRDPAAWKKAVAQDGIGIWRHVLRGLDMEKRMANKPNPEDISEYYGIHSLPTKILIDPEGKIIGRYGGGGEDDDAMDKRLASIFGAI